VGLRRLRDRVLPGAAGARRIEGAGDYLASAKNEEERELYRSRIAREQRLLDELHGDFPDRFAA
jgi:hypothetical protein